MSPIPVVGAAAVRGREVLAALRSPAMSTPGVWEFPGGKVESGESDQEALRRELREELGVDATVGPALGVVRRARIELRVYLVELHGEPHPGEHEALRWVGAEQLHELTWAEADQPLLAPLARHLRGDTG